MREGGGRTRDFGARGGGGEREREKRAVALVALIGKRGEEY